MNWDQICGQIPDSDNVQKMAYLNEVDFIKIFVMKPENGMYFWDYVCPVFLLAQFNFKLVQKSYKFLDMSLKAKFSYVFSFSITGQDILKLFTSQNKRGCNPLMTAAEFESNDVLQFLLNYLKGLVISKGIFNLVQSFHGCHEEPRVPRSSRSRTPV